MIYQSLRPRSLFAASFLFTLILGAVLVPADSEAALWCGSTRAYYKERGTRQYVAATNIYADGLNCRKAKRIAKTWSKKSRLSIRPAKRARGYRCHYFRIGSDVGTTVCWKGSNPKIVFSSYDSSPYH